MIRIKVIAVGRPRHAWVKQACSMYADRLAKLAEFKLAELKNADHKSIAASLEREGRLALAEIAEKDAVYVLDEKGKQLETRELAGLLELDSEAGKVSTFIVGGAYGLSRKVLARADRSISLSKFTLPHQLAKVVLLEQIYRCVTILRNMPYHHGVIP